MVTLRTTTEDEVKGAKEERVSSLSFNTFNTRCSSLADEEPSMFELFAGTAMTVNMIVSSDRSGNNINISDGTDGTDNSNIG